MMILDELRRPVEGSYLGFGWLFVKPILFLLLYGCLFSVVFAMRTGTGSITGGYLTYLLAGLLPWYIFSDSLSSGVPSLRTNASIVANFVFPVEIIPIVKVCAASVSGIVGLGLFAVVMTIQQTAGWSISLVVVLLACQTLLSIGLAIILSILNVLIKDVGQMLPFILLVWMLLSPVGYGDDAVPEWVGMTFGVNPITYFLEAYRMILLHDQVPPVMVWVLVIGFGSIAAIAGLWFASRATRIVRDLV